MQNFILSFLANDQKEKSNRQIVYSDISKINFTSLPISLDVQSRKMLLVVPHVSDI